jgi:uncharacterized protein
VNTQLVPTAEDIVNPTKRLREIKDDPSDNRILEAALVGRADYIVSNDNHLLKLKKYRRIRIINAGEFLKILDPGSSVFG